VISVPKISGATILDEAQENIAEISAARKRGPIEAIPGDEHCKKNPKREIALADASHGQRKSPIHLTASRRHMARHKMNQGKTKASRAKRRLEQSG